MSWLTMHIDEFVSPVLGEDFVPQRLNYFEPEEMTVIKNAWRSIKKKANRKQILLAGRDVFIFEILARREGYPTVFLPECSRMTVRKMAEELGPRIQDCFLFDTGFAGSIPTALKSRRFSMMSHIRRGEGSVQVFPRLSFSRGLVLKIEKTPKYWKTGHIEEGRVVQSFSDPQEFYSAACLTVEVYKNSSPKFINQHQPIRTKGW